MNWEAMMHLVVLGILLAFLSLFTIGCTTTSPKVVCPRLAPPPASTVDALEQAGRKDPSSAAWVIDLDRHYQKLDACR